MIKENICGNCKNWSECATFLRNTGHLVASLTPKRPHARNLKQNRRTNDEVPL